MSRKMQNIHSTNIFHVTSRCINRDWFSVPTGSVWNIMEDYLYLTQKCFDLQIHSFVLMANHFHLLLAAPNGNLSQAMGFFLRHTSHQIAKPAGRINQIWANRFKRCELTDESYFLNTYKYVYQNPLRAGLCGRVEDYQFSTLSRKLGKYKLIIPVVEDAVLFSGSLEKNLEWLNLQPDQADIEALRKALRHSHFRYPRQNKYPHRLENDAL